jgi:hypothetical protein
MLEYIISGGEFATINASAALEWRRRGVGLGRVPTVQAV